MEAMTAHYLELQIYGIMDNLTNLLQKFSNNETDFSDDEMDMLYDLGYRFFTCGNYKAAKEIFTGLTGIFPYTGFYWRALGAVNQQTKDYAEAIDAYDMAIVNDDKDIVSYVYRGESYILSGEIELGLKDFEEVLNIGTEEAQNEPFLKRCELLLSLHRKSESS